MVRAIQEFVRDITTGPKMGITLNYRRDGEPDEIIVEKVVRTQWGRKRVHAEYFANPRAAGISEQGI